MLGKARYGEAWHGIINKKTEKTKRRRLKL